MKRIFDVIRIRKEFIPKDTIKAVNDLTTLIKTKLSKSATIEETKDFLIAWESVEEK